MRITTTSSFAIAAALSLAFGAVQPAAAQNARIAAGAAGVVNPDSMMPMISRVLSSSIGEISRNAAASGADFESDPRKDQDFEPTKVRIFKVVPDDDPRGEFDGNKKEPGGDGTEADETGNSGTDFESDPRKDQDFDPTKVKIFKVVPDDDPRGEFDGSKKEPDGAQPLHGNKAPPPRKGQPFEPPEIIKIVLPPVNRGAPTETVELAHPCFATGVIVSPLGDYEDSDEEQVTDSSEISCSGSFSSPVTVASER